MVSFFTVCQATFLVFLALWSRSARFVLSVVSWFRPRPAPPELPVTAPLPPIVCVSRKSGSVLQGIADKIRLFSGPKEICVMPSNVLPEEAAAAGGRLRSCANYENDIFDICPPPLTLTCDMGPIQTIPTTPVPYLASTSDVSVCSTVLISPPPFTPSSPYSPTLRIQIITPEDDPLCSRHIGLHFSTFGLSSKRSLGWEDSVSLKRMSAESYSVGFATLSACVRNSWPLVGIHAPTHEFTRRISLTDLHSVNPIPIPNAFDVNSIHEKFPNSFDSDDRSMGDLISDAEEFDWPIPPGPVFRFEDDHDHAIVSPAIDSAKTVLKLHLPVRPLHIVKRNAAPHSPNLSDLSSSESDESDYSPPSSPSPINHCHQQDTFIAGYLGDNRSQRLTSILASLPREELITMSNLPSGTIVTLGESESEDDEAGYEQRDDFPGNLYGRHWQKEWENKNDFVDERNYSGNIFRSSSLNAVAGSSSTISSMSHDLAWAPIPSVQKHHSRHLPPLVPPTLSPYTSADSPPPSPLDSVISPITPFIECAPSPVRGTEKQSKSIGDEITLREAEYRHWIMPYKFGFQTQDNAPCHYLKEGDDDHHHWSDVLLIESYV